MALPRRAPMAFPPLSRGVKWIILVTAGAHLALAILGQVDRDIAVRVIAALALQPSGLFEHGPQGLLTLLLVHDGFFHLFFNLLALYLIGVSVELAMGTMRFLRLYIVAALCGSLLYVAVQYAIGSPGTRAVGASGAVFGVVAAFSFLFPDAEVRIWFTMPLRAAYVVWVALAADVIFALAGNPVAVPVHVGGVLGAFLFVFRPWRRGNARRLWLRARQWWIRRRLRVLQGRH